jgi:hypothetical protein
MDNRIEQGKDKIISIILPVKPPIIKKTEKYSIKQKINRFIVDVSGFIDSIIDSFS